MNELDVVSNKQASTIKLRYLKDSSQLLPEELPQKDLESLVHQISSNNKNRPHNQCCRDGFLQSISTTFNNEAKTFIQSWMLS